jgi:hypothetical protein
MRSLKDQLEIFGVQELIRRAEMEPLPPPQKRRTVRRIETLHEMLSELPASEDLSFLHSGFCQTCLPHSRLADDSHVWRRTAGRFSLIVTPGVIHDDRLGGNSSAGSGARYVGVPYGSRARLIMIHLQSEGVKNRAVNLGRSLSSFLRSLGLSVTGGQRGSINAIREQSLRIARCGITMQWSEDNADGSRRIVMSDTRIVEGLDLTYSQDDSETSKIVYLSQAFHEHLKEHAVPLDRRGISYLSGNSLGLDLYCLMAHRLPRLKNNLHLSWIALQAQIGSTDSAGFSLAKRIRDVMPDVLTAYPEAKLEVTTHGLLLKPSLPAVPRTMVNGYRLIDSRAQS